MPRPHMAKRVTRDGHEIPAPSNASSNSNIEPDTPPAESETRRRPRQRQLTDKIQGHRQQIEASEARRKKLAAKRQLSTTDSHDLVPPTRSRKRALPLAQSDDEDPLTTSVPLHEDSHMSASGSGGQSDTSEDDVDGLVSDNDNEFDQLADVVVDEPPFSSAPVPIQKPTKSSKGPRPRVPPLQSIGNHPAAAAHKHQNAQLRHLSRTPNPRPADIVDTIDHHTSTESSSRPGTPGSNQPPPPKVPKHSVGEEPTTRRRQRVRAADFTPEYQSTILLACRYYRVLVCTENAFPAELDQDQFARESWQLASHEYDVDLPPSRRIYSLIRQRGSQVRGEVKRQVRPLVISHYGFEAGDPKDDMNPTAGLVHRLKEGHNLVYRDHIERAGLFENPIVLQALKAQWFADANDEGVHFHLYFNPVPLPLLALIFAAIENCIDEWKSGRLHQLDFTEKAYKDIYEEHLSNLDKFQMHARGGPILARLQQRLHDRARTHSGANAIANPHVSRITDDDFDAAVREAELDGA